MGRGLEPASGRVYFELLSLPLPAPFPPAHPLACLLSAALGGRHLVAAAGGQYAGCRLQPATAHDCPALAQYWPNIWLELADIDTRPGDILAPLLAPDNKIPRKRALKLPISQSAACSERPTLTSARRPELERRHAAI